MSDLKEGDIERFSQEEIAEQAFRRLQSEQELPDAPFTAEELEELKLREGFTLSIDELTDDPDPEALFDPRTQEQISSEFGIPLPPEAQELVLLNPGTQQRIDEALSHFDEKIDPRTTLPVAPLQDLENIADRLQAQNIEPLDVGSANKANIKKIISDRVITLTLDEIMLLSGDLDVLEPDEARRILTKRSNEGDIDDLERLTVDLQTVLQQGLKETLASPNPSLNSERLIATVAKALHEVVDDKKINDTRSLVAIVDKVILSLVGPIGIASIAKNPIVGTDEIVNLFPAHLESLLNHNKLSLDQIRSITNEFDVRLLQFKVKALEGEVPDINNELVNMSKYVRDHVNNPRLKELMLRDIQIMNETLALKFGEIPERRISTRAPISIVKNIESINPITKSLLEDKLARLVSSAESSLKVFDITREGLKEDKRKRRDERDFPAETKKEFTARSVRESLKVTIKEINRLSLKHNLVMKRPGKPARPIHLTSRTSGGEQKSVFDILDEFKAIQKSMKGEFRLTRSPQISEGEIATEDDIQAEIRAIKTPIRKGIRPRIKRRKRTIIKHTGKTKLGRILILKDENDERKELVIPKDTKIGDLLKLSAALHSEDGSLETQDGRVIMKIIRHQTIKPIVKNIMSELIHNAGHDIRLLWFKKHATGGHFLDGIFAPIMKDSFTTPFIGGGFPNPLHIISEIPINMFTRFGGVVSVV